MFRAPNTLRDTLMLQGFNEKIRNVWGFRAGTNCHMVKIQSKFLTFGWVISVDHVSRTHDKHAKKKNQESASKQNRRPPNRCPIFLSFRLEPFRDWSPLRLDECWPYKASQKTSRPKLRYPVETINKAELCQLCSLLGFDSPQSKVHYIHCQIGRFPSTTEGV